MFFFHRKKNTYHGTSPKTTTFFDVGPFWDHEQWIWILFIFLPYIRSEILKIKRSRAVQICRRLLCGDHASSLFYSSNFLTLFTVRIWKDLRFCEHHQARSKKKSSCWKVLFICESLWALFCFVMLCWKCSHGQKGVFLGKYYFYQLD